MYPTDDSYKYERRDAIFAVYILIIPGIINYEKKMVLIQKCRYQLLHGSSERLLEGILV